MVARTEVPSRVHHEDGIRSTSWDLKGYLFISSQSRVVDTFSRREEFDNVHRQ
jgi:hypothetical protein